MEGNSILRDVSVRYGSIDIVKPTRRIAYCELTWTLHIRFSFYITCSYTRMLIEPFIKSLVQLLRGYFLYHGNYKKDPNMTS
jgi:hypothetical protein